MTDELISVANAAIGNFFEWIRLKEILRRMDFFLLAAYLEGREAIVADRSRFLVWPVQALD